MVIKEEKSNMNKKKIVMGIIIMIFATSLPVYGDESYVTSQGNITGLEEEVYQLEEDYNLLENEILELNQSVSGSTIVKNKSRKSLIESKGNISFENGKVYFSAKDLVSLAEEIDNLENSYKCNLVDALNQIGTYFKKDGTIVYDSSQNEVEQDEVKRAISLGCIKQGIISSQSIESVSNIQALDGNQNPLYYVNEDARNNNENLNITTEDTSIPLYYKEAGANNLSAGSAAWVNGVLLKGNGEDNRISWQNGYNEGYSKGVADSLNKANIVYSYHQHTEQGGECYGTLSGVRPIRCGCTSFAYTDSLPGYEGIPSCEFCHHYHAGRTCDLPKGYESYSYIGLVCGKTEQTIESATIVY